MIICPWCDAKQEPIEENGELICRKCEWKIGVVELLPKLITNARLRSINLVPDGLGYIKVLDDPIRDMMRDVVKRVELELRAQILLAGLDPDMVEWRPIVISTEDDFQNNRIHVSYGVELVRVIPREELYGEPVHLRQV